VKWAIFMPKIIEKTSKNGVITAFSDGLEGGRVKLGYENNMSLGQYMDSVELAMY
jgi:hypothetical protein